MAFYNLFFIDPRGAVLHRLTVRGENDEAVLDRVAQHDDGHDIEIWDGERLVAIFRSRKRRV